MRFVAAFYLSLQCNEITHSADDFLIPKQLLSTEKCDEEDIFTLLSPVLSFLLAALLVDTLRCHEKSHT